MNWLRLSLILVIGNWTVFAAETKTNVTKAPRIIGTQDVRVLISPLDILYAKNATSKPTPTKFAIRSVYSEYPHRYPSYPPHPYPSHPYPDYPYDHDHHYYHNYHGHHHPYHAHPTYHATPSQEHHLPPNQTPYGYYPIYNSSPSNDYGQQQPPIVLVYGPEPQHHGHHHEHWNDEHFNHDGRLIVTNFGHPLTENAQTIEVLEDNETELPDQENDNKTKLRGVSIINDSGEDSDSIIIDTDHIKLPFGIQLASEKAAASEKSNKKLKHQEALIYLRNFKKGRMLEKAPKILN